MSALAARVPPQPITFMYRNLVWGRYSDEVWAVYGLEMQSYEGRVAPIRVDPGPRLLEDLDTTPGGERGELAA